MQANIYDRLHIILQKLKGVESRLDLLERSGRKRGHTKLNTFYGEQKKPWKAIRGIFKKHDNINLRGKKRFRNKKKFNNK